MLFADVRTFVRALAGAAPVVLILEDLHWADPASLELLRHIGPLVGSLPVAGLPLPQIRAKIGAALASKVYRPRTSDGREAAIVIDADEVTTTVAEYRPI